ncbi:threonine aldolase family protein (plasmid) [Nocardioides sp. R1-1]|uniref:threonine aldolase family protein n=1 Tax=Nocardioides sp. R1-1 TaxID=3383502 RepID=UPI0038D182CB
MNNSTGRALRHHGFASDTCAGAHPEVLAAIAAASEGYEASYGGDGHTAALQHQVRHHFGEAAQALPVFNGTGANVVALRSMTAGGGSVICAATAHINVDECGAPEWVSGAKLLPIATTDGKLTPDLVDSEAHGFDDVHRVRPRVLSVSQATEHGTVYDPDELIALCEHAHSRGLTVHMDGARLANAAATLGVPLSALTTEAGVDVLSFGGTKNGLIVGDAVIVLHPGAVHAPEYARMGSAQLGSKLRFVSAQLNVLLHEGLWLRNAQRANAMARRLASAVRGLPGVDITRPVQANSVFATLPRAATVTLHEKYDFHVWDDRRGEVRWMTSFATTEHEVDELAGDIRAAVAQAA